MKYPFIDLHVPTEGRTFDSYYADRLYAMDTVLITLIETVHKAVPEGSLFGLLETMVMAHTAAQDRLGEVEEYIRSLEARLNPTAPVGLAADERVHE